MDTEGMTRVEHVAYFAGVLDGEGTIDWKNPGTIRVRVPNTCHALLAALCVQWGGSICTDNSSRRDGFERRDRWLWTLSGNAAAILIRESREYLHVKGGQADAALECWNASCDRYPRRQAA